MMLDTGINRLGIGSEQMNTAMFDGLDIDILASHLASADEDGPQNGRQLALFAEMGSVIKARRRSLTNSAGLMLGADYHFDLTRPGLALYGGIARPEMAEFITPVVSIAAKVLQIRQLLAGDPVGYNATFVSDKPTRVATIALGYADGYLRSFSGKGVASFGGVTMPVIGRVSMDLVTIDASGVSGLAEGDWVTICFDLLIASAQSGLSQYELLTGLGNRFENLWM